MRLVYKATGKEVKEGDIAVIVGGINSDEVNVKFGTLASNWKKLQWSETEFEV